MNVRPRAQVKNLGVYVPGKPIEEVQRELGLDRVIKLASNESPWGPSPLAVEAARRALDKLFLYPDANAYGLKQAICRKLAADPAQIITGNGSEEIVQMIAKTFVDPGDQVVMAAPSFPRYKAVTELMGGTAVEVSLNEYRHDLPAMAAAISQRTKVVFVCNPNNPTGTIVTEQELDNFMAQVPEGVLAVFDEAYFEYVQDARFCSGLKYLAQERQVLVLRTFSKAFGLAALRIGYAVGPRDIIDLLNRVREPFNGNQVAQEAAGAAWADQQYLAQVVKNNALGLRQLSAGLSRLGFTPLPSQTNFVLVEAGKSSERMFQELLQRGIIVRPGHLFGCPTALRVSVGTREDNDAFLEAMAEIV